MATRVIELEENFIPVLYNDDDPQNLHPSRDHGNCTIGYGTKLHDGPCTAADHERYPGPITRQQAQALLERDEATAAAAVTSYVHVKLSAAQQAALMSFSYNVGSEALRGSTLVRLLNRGDRTGAANQLLRWVHANGQRLPGLVNRRQRERQIFLGTAPVGANLTAPSQSRAIGPDIISQASPVSVALVPPGTLTAGEIATLVGGGATAGCVINLSVVVPGQSPYPVIALPPVTAGDDGSFTVRWPVPSSLTDSLTWTVSGAETCL
jgi:lysozyme